MCRHQMLTAFQNIMTAKNYPYMSTLCFSRACGDRYTRPTMRRIVLNETGCKRLAVLSPTDLVPREVAEAWLKYLREELPTVAFKCSTQKQASNLGQRHLPKASSADTALQGSECLGANTLLHLLKNYTRNSDTKTAITVGENPLFLRLARPATAVAPGNCCIIVGCKPLLQANLWLAWEHIMIAITVAI